jgi:hypothetical protein
VIGCVWTVIEHDMHTTYMDDPRFCIAINQEAGWVLKLELAIVLDEVVEVEIIDESGHIRC